MSKKNRNFRKKNSDLGIKVGDWFEDISGSKHGFKYIYVVKSLNQTTVRLVKFGIDSGVLSEVYCVDYGINNFEKVKNILEVADELELKKIGGDEARNRLKKVEGVSLILECFGVDQKKVSPQNPPSTQSTPPESKSSSHEKTVKEFLEIDKNPLVDLKGKHLKYTKEDWDGTTEYFQIKNLDRKVRSSYPGDGYCNIQYGTRFLVDRSGKITNKTSDEHESFPFESFKDAVIITEEEFNKARSREGFKKQEKPIKIYTKEELKSSILKYTSPDGSIYYLEHPEIPKVGIENKPGKFKYCVVSYGIMISNGGQVHFYTPKTNTFNPIVLLIESESDEGFFSRVEEIPDYEWASLKEFYQDEIVKI